MWGERSIIRYASRSEKKREICKGTHSFSNTFDLTFLTLTKTFHCQLGASVQDPDKNGLEAPLVTAAKNDNVTAVLLLLKVRADNGSVGFM